jgi:hypothetical protein
MQKRAVSASATGPKSGTTRVGYRGDAKRWKQLTNTCLDNADVAAVCWKLTVCLHTMLSRGHVQKRVAGCGAPLRSSGRRSLGVCDVNQLW